MPFFIRIGFLVFVLGVGSIHAATVQPMRFELSPIGADSRTKLQLTNDSSETITVEATSWRSAVSSDGNETLTPADDDIIVFPPTAVVDPGKTQYFQVQYIGDPELSASQLYRVRVEQLPVKLDKSKSGLAVTLQFNTMLNVVPPGSSAVTKINSIKPGKDPGSLIVELKNSGNRFVRLHDTIWTIDRAGKSSVVPNSVVRELVPDVLVLPHSTRNITVTPPPSMALQNSSITISSAE
jgi:P pilus assembly chaperone PapD